MFIATPVLRTTSLSIHPPSHPATHPPNRPFVHPLVPLSSVYTCSALYLKIETYGTRPLQSTSTSTSVRWTVKFDFYSTGWLLFVAIERWKIREIGRKKICKLIMKITIESDMIIKIKYLIVKDSRKKVFPIAFGSSGTDRSAFLGGTRALRPRQHSSLTWWFTRQVDP